MELTKLDPPEKSRTYLYPNDVTLRFENVVEFGRGTTTHRLALADGRKVIVEPGWLAIVLDVEKFTL